jgi:cell division control protein 6
MIYKEAKALFRRCSVPARLIGRERERAVITAFVEQTLLQGKHGALYISGMPGTGMHCV